MPKMVVATGSPYTKVKNNNNVYLINDKNCHISIFKFCFMNSVSMFPI